MSKPLSFLLKQLNLLNAVFFKENGKNYDGFISEVQKKIEIIEPDAYYVFNKQPLILFFDLTDEKNKVREKEIHKQVWSFDNSPVIFVIKGDEIRVYNALNYSKKEESLEEIKLTKEERESKFSFWELQSGYTWKWLQNEYFENRSKKQHRKRVNERLFQNIKEVREYLTNISSESPLSENDANSLILRLIFIRYLIDRKVKIDETFISGVLDDVNERRKSFINLIKEPTKLNLLFQKLNTKFNGVLFRELDVQISQNKSNFLADVFKGELQDENNLFEGFFFEIFDFSIIPVEVISGIYESLIDEETRKLDSAVYTPPFLVEYILNDTVDKYLEKENKSECKIFEVAVGSGIFLVQSLRKMIDKELELNPNQSPKDFSERIRNIAKRNLFGIDINEEALKVACFSIYIALLDYQNPKDIDVYEFPNLLNENLFKADFFDTNHIFNNLIKEDKPKFILGNPPWKKDKSKNHLDWVNSTKTYSKKIKGELEIAQSFLLRTKDFMSVETKSALIVTSTLFYNVSTTNKEFKTDFLSTFCVNKFFDLSPVRRLVFNANKITKKIDKKGNVKITKQKIVSPASIVYFSLSNGESHLKNIINHQSVKSNYFLKHFKILVIEKYDQKKIQQKYFIENDWMFKLALYGNTLDYRLIKKLSKLTKANTFLDEKKAYKGLGVIKTSGQSKTEPKHYPNLIDYPVIENSAVERYFTPLLSSTKILKEEDVYFIRGRVEELFNKPKILLKEQCTDETFLSVSYQDEKSVYVNGVSGVSFDDEGLTKLLYSYLISNITTYYLYLISCSWGVATRPAIRFGDEFLSFPFVEPEKKIAKNLTSLVSNFLIEFKNHYYSFPRPESLPISNTTLSQINKIIYKLYGIKGYEKDLVDYVLNVSRYQFQESKQYLVSDFNYTDKTHYRNKEFVLNEYASVYIEEFNEIYKDEYIQVEVYPLEHFIALNFVFSKTKVKKGISYPKDKKNEADVLKRLAINLSISQITDTKDPTKNLFIQKDIKGFEDNSFYIIKPNEYKCWHKAMAWYDVAEFKEAIQEAELDESNKFS
ncbi:Eco57I restriction-modification methylase domain-containing protein [Polaribacter sp. Asnod1-A03]|uniref:Eco57I restriction-modification methylase domain-containing protein n=1 Tax=Polaribacter sp. Asnod1-A03 TaxID=3160581 RepID=UPI00386400CD